MIKIVADSAILFVEHFFSRIGEIMLVDGEQISPETLSDADILVCRSLTKVNQQLLENSTVHIVASPTSGTDHVDLDYLGEHSISFASAPGSNAAAVVEYVLSALCVLADQKGIDLTKKKVGIIGCGHVGSRLRHFFQVIGIECLVYDPYLQAAGDGGDYSELRDIQQADIITLHVPLTTDGPYPTRGMLDANFFQALVSDVILINTARGEVLDEHALLTFLRDNAQAMAVIDVWENEPAIDTALLAYVDIATPHIAGYGLDGKLRATKHVFEQVCKTMQIDCHCEDLNALLPVEVGRNISLSQYESDIDAVSLAVLASYDVRSDAAAFRRMLDDDVVDRNIYFSELRNNYPVRREFSSLGIVLEKEAESLRDKLLTLGFSIIRKD